jgi:hypothetical protein
MDELRRISGVALDTKNLLMNSDRAALAKKKRERGPKQIFCSIKKRNPNPPLRRRSLNLLTKFSDLLLNRRQSEAIGEAKPNDNSAPVTK